MQFFEPMGFVGGKGPKDRPTPPKVGGGVPDKPHPQASLLALIDQSIRALQDEPNSGKAAVDAVEYLKKIREAVQ